MATSPAATNASLGSRSSSIAFSVVALTQPGPWTVSILFNQIWSVSGGTWKLPDVELVK